MASDFRVAADTSGIVAYKSLIHSNFPGLITSRQLQIRKRSFVSGFDVQGWGGGGGMFRNQAKWCEMALEGGGV